MQGMHSQEQRDKIIAQASAASWHIS